MPAHQLHAELRPIYHALTGEIVRGAIAIDPRPPVRVLINARWNISIVVDAAFSYLSANCLGVSKGDCPTLWHHVDGKQTSTPLGRLIAERCGLAVEGRRVYKSNGDKLDLRLGNLHLKDCPANERHTHAEPVTAAPTTDRFGGARDYIIGWARR